jgi:hypothetical protein
VTKAARDASHLPASMRVVASHRHVRRVAIDLSSQLGAVFSSAAEPTTTGVVSKVLLRFESRDIASR